MNNLPNYTSFQGVLDSIIRSYLLNELPPEAGENGVRYQNIAERDLGLSQANFLQNLQNQGTNLNQRTNAPRPTEQNNNTEAVQLPGTSASAQMQSLQNASNEHEYVKALYQCFEKRGVFKELQTFLRHKLVSILQDEWPEVKTSSSISSKVGENTLVFRLIEDFLKCHKLLYTLSVLVSEGDVKTLHTKSLYGKMSAKEGEDLLDELGIKRGTRLSGQILKCYFDQIPFSLLESMHYLGVWVDGSVSHNLDERDELDNIKKSREKNGNGETIFLSRHVKSSGKVTMADAQVQCVATSESTLSVERRMLDLRKRLEKEKEEKIRDEIDRYKNEEKVRLREEMEAEYQLQLVEKEKEYLVDIQKRMEELDFEVQKERQKWREEKVRQEKELMELRKNIAEITKKEILSTKFTEDLHAPQTSSSVHIDPLVPPNRRENYSPLDNFPNYPQCSCGCTCKGKSTLRKSNLKSERRKEPEKGIVMVEYKSTPLDAVQQDQLVFLQYKLEQQEDEIQTLRMQLQAQASPRALPTNKNKKKSTPVGAGDAQRSLEHSYSTSGPDESRGDDLGSFLTEARNRAGKLDVAISKVDEIVQAVLERKREATPISTHISSRLQASAEQRRLKRSLFTTTNPNLMYNEVPMPRPQSALVQQQLPEKQVKFATLPPKCSINSNNYSVYDKYKQNCRSETIPEVTASPRLFTDIPNVVPVPIPVQSQFQQEQQMPSTPRDRLFPVAYESTIPRRKSETINLNTQQPPKESRRKDVLNSTRNPEPNNEESLFHMAAKQMLDDSASSSSNSKENSFEEKAISNGALSREKVPSLAEDDDDDVDCRSVSIAESISIGLKHRSTVLTSRNGNVKINGDGIKKESSIQARVQTVKAGESKILTQELNGAAKEPNNLIRKKNEDEKIPVALELSRSEPSGLVDETDLEENDLTISNISAPKSEDVEDFWQI